MIKALLKIFALALPVYIGALFYAANYFFQTGYIENLGFNSTLFPLDFFASLSMGDYYLTNIPARRIIF